MKSNNAGMRTAAALCAVVATAASADPLVTPVGDGTNASTVSETQYNGVEFTFASSFINVAIDASLTNDTGAGGGTAYLTTAIGPGTTAADVVAMEPFKFAAGPGFDPTYVSLFSGLSLDAGTYYVLFAAPFDPAGSAGAIDLGSAVTYDTAPDVSVGSMYFAGSGIDPTFAPASTWSTSGLGNRFFRVSGEVPAPASAVLFGLGGLAMARRRR